MIKKQQLLALVFAMSTGYIYGQDTPIDTTVNTIDKIDIVKKYQYAIKKVKKLDTQPEFLDSNFITKTFNYELPLVGNRESKPLISPIKNSFFNLNSEVKKHLSYSNYIIGAFSSKANPFAELSLAQEIDNYKFGIFGQYHADNQTDNQKPFFGFEHARLDGYFDYLKEKLLFQTEAGFQIQEEKLVIDNDGHYTHHNIFYNKSNLKIGLENLSKRSFVKNAAIELKGISEKNNNSETYIKVNTTFSDYLLSESLLWNVNANYHLSVNEMDENKFDNNLSIFDVQPKIQGDKDNFFYTAGLNFLMAWDDNHIGGGPVSYIIPELKLTYRFNKSYNLSVGLTSDYELNDYLRIQNLNPYLTESGVDTRTRVSKLFYGKVDGIISGITYRLDGKYSVGGDRLFYQSEAIAPFTFIKNNAVLPNTLTAVGISPKPNAKESHIYNTYYEQGDYMSLNLNLDYKFTKQISFNLDLLIQKYNLKNDVKASHTPALTTHIKTTYKINDQIATYGTLKYNTKQYMINNVSLTDNTKRTVQKTVDPTFDVSLGAYYDIRRQWRVFGEINNLLDNNYETWGSYLHKGIYITGGFRFKF